MTTLIKFALSAWLLHAAIAGIANAIIRFAMIAGGVQ